MSSIYEYNKLILRMKEVMGDLEYLDSSVSRLQLRMSLSERIEALKSDLEINRSVEDFTVVDRDKVVVKTKRDLSPVLEEHPFISRYTAEGCIYLLVVVEGEWL